MSETFTHHFLFQTLDFMLAVYITEDVLPLLNSQAIISKVDARLPCSLDIGRRCILATAKQMGSSSSTAKTNLFWEVSIPSRSRSHTQNTWVMP